MRQTSKVLGATGLLLISLLSGCASTTINSGLQVGNLPPVGVFTAENGIEFIVQPLTLTTIPPKRTVQPSQDLQRLVRTSNRADYRIAEGDVLSIILVDYPNINASTASLSVDQQGLVQIPLIGRIKASGMSVPQFTSKLRSQLQRYLKYSDPQVKIIEYAGNSFIIDGQVIKAGEFNITDAPVSLYSAISMAGGISPTGDSNNITLNRNGISYNINLQSLREIGSSANQIYVQNGDSIFIDTLDINKVYVLGEFGRVAPVPILQQGLNLAQVIGESAGLNSNTANAAKVYVVRDDTAYRRTNIYYIDMQTITSFPLANRFEMLPDDIVYVDPTGLTRWNRVLSALLPSSSAIRSVAAF